MLAHGASVSFDIRLRNGTLTGTGARWHQGRLKTFPYWLGIDSLKLLAFWLVTGHHRKHHQGRLITFPRWLKIDSTQLLAFRLVTGHHRNDLYVPTRHVITATPPPSRPPRAAEHVQGLGYDNHQRRFITFPYWIEIDWSWVGESCHV